MLVGVLVASRRTRSRGAAMHAAAAFPLTAGDMQVLPERVSAPQRPLANIGPVLRIWLLVIRLCSL